jgi:hypothetical protein
MTEKFDMLGLLKTFFEVVIDLLENKEIERFVSFIHPVDTESIGEKVLVKMISEGSANVTIEQMIIDYKQDLKSLKATDIFEYNSQKYGNSFFVQKGLRGYGFTEGSWKTCNYKI